MGILDGLLDVASWTWGNLDKISTVAGTAGTAYAMLSDPYEDTRRVLEAQAMEERKALEQWRRQQDELFKMQLTDASSTQALQENFRKQFGEILSGEVDIASSPMFAHQFARLNQQKAEALRQIEESFPAGGAKERAMRSVMQGYADRQAQLAGEIQKTIFSWAGQLQMPYSQVGGAMPQTGGANQSLLSLQQSGSFDPTAFFQIAKGWGDVYDRGEEGTPTGAGGNTYLLPLPSSTPPVDRSIEGMYGAQPKPPARRT